MKKVYKIVNVFVLSATFVLFFSLYANEGEKEHGLYPYNIVILMIMVIIVYGIKAFRLYFMIFDQKISVVSFLKQYCKALPVSIIFPFKLGELFKIYCYGYALQNYFNGAVVVMLDRFVDTLALVSIITVLSVIYGTNPGTLLYVLIAFIASIMVCYLLFPGMYRYWKHYFIKAKATENGLKILSLFEKLNESYTEVQKVVKGRYAIAYMISLIVWIIELGGVAVINQFDGERNALTGVTEYLESVLYGFDSGYLRQFILVSVVAMLVAYVVLYLTLRLKKEAWSHGR